MRSLLLALVSLFALGDPAADARSWRSLTASRPRGTVDSLHVAVRYDAGTLTLGAAPAALLYQTQARFDANEQRLSRSYNPVSHTLRVGLDSSTMSKSARHSNRARSDEGRLDVALAAVACIHVDRAPAAEVLTSLRTCTSDVIDVSLVAL